MLPIPPLPVVSRGTLPAPLPLPLPALLPIPPLPLPLDTRTTAGRDMRIDKGQGFVQVLLDVADDARARLAFVTSGVKMAPVGLCPESGVVVLLRRVDGKGYAYRWRE